MSKHAKKNEEISVNAENNSAEVTETEKTAEVTEQAADNAAETKPEKEANGRHAKKAEDRKGAKSGKGRKRRRRKGGVPLAVVAMLLIVTLLFGVVVGLVIGQRNMEKKLAEKDAEIEMLRVAVEDGSEQPVDVFDDELSEENEEALDDLSGENMEGEEIEEGVLALQGEDGFEGAEPEESEKPASPVVVAEYNGGTIMSDEAQAVYNDRMTEMVLQGYDSEEIADSLMEQILTEMVQDRVLSARAEEMGVAEPTQSEISAIEAEAQSEYDALIEEYIPMVQTDGTEEEIREAAQSMAASDGVTYDSILQEKEDALRTQKLFDAVTADVTVDDAAVEAQYNALIAEQKEAFTDAGEYEFARSGDSLIVYNPEGYRDIYVLSLTAAEGAETTPAEQAEKILADVAGGKTLQELTAVYGADGAVHAFCADNAVWPEDVTAAAMALENKGDVSAAIAAEEGIVILQYIDDIQSGEIPLSQVRDQVEQLASAQVRQDAYDAQLAAWMEEAAPKYYPERMQ